MKQRIVVLALLSAAASAVAQVHDHAPAPAPVAPVHEQEVPAAPAPTAAVAPLSPELRELFKLEMLGLQGAMLELVPRVVAGDWEGIAETAARIRGGFVLAQKLTPAQREELHRALPAGFIERDAEFHEIAIGLEHAAHRKQTELVSFYVYKLTEGCVGCHSRYAQTRFPAFAPAHAPDAHAH
jgi:hypothetical protein